MHIGDNMLLKAMVRIWYCTERYVWAMVRIGYYTKRYLKAW